jgi:hypothetical protein
MKRNMLILILAVVAFAFAPANAFASDTGSIYGHVSYVEGNPKVVRADNTQEDAVVNLPIAPGDVIVTGKDSKCEFQFDNGTVMRLGKNSRLKVTTVLAKTLTSKWKVTTLELLKGQIYSINQSYNRERFQIITPNAAINLKKNSISMISLKDGETYLSSNRGKFQVMFGEKASKLKTETVQKGKGFVITADHKLKETEKRDIDFLSWNQYIDKNFKNLHHGISKLPAKIYKYPKGLVRWAEKWSSLFGEWVYDDLFGYVWKPADEIFAYSARPFFHANFTTINGQLFMVPQQPWGWIPSMMGNWVWMKWGWTWIPGTAFGSSIHNMFFKNSAQYSHPYWYPTVGYYMDVLYGGWDLYYHYRHYGYDGWYNEYQRIYGKAPVKPQLGIKKLPADVKTVFRKLNNAPLAKIKDRIGERTPEMKRPIPTFKRTPGISVTKAPAKPAVVKGKLTKLTKTPVKGKLSKAAITKARFDKLSKDKIRIQLIRERARRFRDWNPDARWAKFRGVSFHYSSKGNEVICPQLKLRSSTITNGRRNQLRNSMRGSIHSRGVIRGGGYSGDGSSGNSAGGTSTGSSSSMGSVSVGGGSKSGPGSGGGTTKEGSK